MPADIATRQYPCFHIENILNNPAGCCGVSNGGNLQGNFLFTGDLSDTTPLFWGIEWDITILNGGTFGDTLDADFGILFFTAGIRNAVLAIPTGPLLPSQTIHGSAFGSTGDNNPFFRAGTDLFGRTMAGESRITFDARIAFSDKPFSDFPGGPGSAAVPEPSTLTLFGLGVLGLLGLSWRVRKEEKPDAYSV